MGHNPSDLLIKLVGRLLRGVLQELARDFVILPDGVRIGSSPRWLTDLRRGRRTFLGEMVAHRFLLYDLSNVRASHVGAPAEAVLAGADTRRGIGLSPV